jgi:hypothetical protein
MRLRTARRGDHMFWTAANAVKKTLARAKTPGPITMPARMAETGAGAEV